MFYPGRSRGPNSTYSVKNKTVNIGDLPRQGQGAKFHIFCKEQNSKHGMPCDQSSQDQGFKFYTFRYYSWVFATAVFPNMALTILNAKRVCYSQERIKPVPTANLYKGTVQDYDNLPVEFNSFCPVALLSGGRFTIFDIFYPWGQQD